MEKETDSQLTAGQGLPAPVCSPPSDTPETDSDASMVWIKCEDTCCEVWAEKNGDTIDVVDADFARKLEREINALRNSIRFAAARFARVNWGYDGDCGVKDIIETLEDLLPENTEGLASPAGSENPKP